MRQGNVKILPTALQLGYTECMSGEQRSVTPRPSIGLRGWLIALFGPLAVTVALIPARSHIRTTNVSLVLVVVILVAAITGGRVGAVIAAIGSAFWFDVFFTRPYNSFRINSADDVETTVLLLVVGLVVGEIVLRSREHQRVAEVRDVEIHQMRNFAELSAGNEPIGKLIRVLQDELVAILPVETAQFERPPFTTVLPKLQHGRITIPGDEDAPREFSADVELPVWGAGRQVGRFVLHLAHAGTGVAISPDDRALAIALADQFGAAIAEAGNTE